MQRRNNGIGKVAHLHASVYQWVKYIRENGALLDLIAYIEITLPFINGQRTPVIVVHYEDFYREERVQRTIRFTGEDANLNARVFLVDHGWLPYE